MDKDKPQSDLSGRSGASACNDLLACPFCKSTMVRYIEASMKYEREAYARIKCDNCHAYGPVGLRKQDAINAWNRRAG